MFVAIIAMTLCCFLVGQELTPAPRFTSIAWAAPPRSQASARLSSPPQQPSRAFCADPSSIGVGASSSWPWDPPSCLVGTAGPFSPTRTSFSSRGAPLQGMGFAIATTASATAAADVLPLSRLGEGIGYYGLGQAIAMSIGPALAMFLVSTDPAENLYLGFSAAAACALAFSLVCRYERNPRSLPRPQPTDGVGKSEGPSIRPSPAPQATPSARAEAPETAETRIEQNGRVAKTPGANDAEPESSARRATPCARLSTACSNRALCRVPSP